MDIAEIRKKARSGKSKAIEASSAAGYECSMLTMPIVAEVPLQLCGRSSEPPSLTEEVAISPLINNVQSTSMTEYRDSVDRLFSWSSSAEVATVDSYEGIVTVEQDKAESNCRQWLAFMLGGEEYSLDIVSIVEIIKPRDITDIPRVPEFLLGIISLRGNIIPIFDLKRRLHLGVSELSSNSRIIVCQEGERFAGLLVDRISQVVSMPALNVEPPPAILTGIDRELVSGVGRHQGKMMILLHLTSVLNIELT